MRLDPLNTEALALAWAAHVGAVTWDEVVIWADGWILRLDTPPEEVLELSLSGSRPDEAQTLLRQLARTGNSKEAVSLLTRRLLDTLQTGRIDAAFIAYRLERIQSLSFSDVPDDVRLPRLPSVFFDVVLELITTLELLPILQPWKLDFTEEVRDEVVTSLHPFL